MTTTTRRRGGRVPAKAAPAGVTVRLLALAVALGACGEEKGGPGAPFDLYEGCSRASGSICTVAGTGLPGDGADLLAPRKTRLFLPTDMAVSPAGALHVIDWNNHRIRAVRPDGLLEIVAGEGELTPEIDDDVHGRLNHPTDIAFDREGRLVIAAWHNSRIKRRDPATGELEDIAGTGARAFGGDGGPALQAALDLPVGIVFDEEGNLYVSDQANQRIRCIDPAGTIKTVAGSGMAGLSGEGGTPLEAKFNLPVGQMGAPAGHIARDAEGRLYLADTLNDRIRRIDLRAGTVTTVAGGGQDPLAEGVPATQVKLTGPTDVAIGPDGALYVADTENGCVRQVKDGAVSTVAGQCGRCLDPNNPSCRCAPGDGACLGDGGPATAARLRRPFGIAFDQDGNLLVADTANHRIRVVFR